MRCSNNIRKITNQILLRGLKLLHKSNTITKERAFEIRARDKGDWYRKVDVIT